MIEKITNKVLDFLPEAAAVVGTLVILHLTGVIHVVS